MDTITPHSLAGDDGPLVRKVNAASDALHSTVESASSSVHGVLDHLASSASRAAESLEERAQRVAGLPGDGWAYCKFRIRSQPVEAVALTFFTGFVLGWLVAKR